MAANIRMGGRHDRSRCAASRETFLATRRHLGPGCLLPCLGDHMVAVDRVDSPVGITMEDDGRKRPPRRAASLKHQRG